MSDVALIALLVLLVWIGAQLRGLRSEQRQMYLEETEQRRRSLLDDMLKLQCPNLFDVSRIDEMREWQRVRTRKLKFYEDRRHTLLDPHSDEPSSWVDIYFMYVPLREQEEDSDYAFPAAANQEEQQFMHACKEETERFIASALSQTTLTDTEMGFLAYWQWRETFLDRDSWRRPLKFDSAHMNTMFESLLQQFATRNQAS